MESSPATTLPIRSIRWKREFYKVTIMNALERWPGNSILLAEGTNYWKLALPVPEVHIEHIKRSTGWRISKPSGIPDLAYRDHEVRKCYPLKYHTTIIIKARIEMKTTIFTRTLSKHHCSKHHSLSMSAFNDTWTEHLICNSNADT